MSTARVNQILDRTGGTNSTINGVLIRPGIIDNDNLIINGAFDFWQRGTSISSPGYISDRWINGSVGGTVTQARQSFSLGDTIGSSHAKFFSRQTVSGQSLASHYAVVAHYIEGVRSYSGQTITILGWARRSSGSGNMSVECLQSFGTGGSPSPATLGINPTIVTLSSSWEPFAVTINVPSIVGKTLGSNNDDWLGINFWSSAGADWASRSSNLGIQTIGIDLWGIHIRRGEHTVSASSSYVIPEFTTELTRCLRYYEKSFPIDTTPAQNVGTVNGAAGFVSQTTGLWQQTVYFHVKKRRTPTITTFSPNAASSNWFTNVDAPVAVVATLSTDRFDIRANSSGVVGRAYYIHWVADAEL